MFDTELQYFISHQQKLVQKYGGKYLVLKGAAVRGAYDSALTAYLEGKKKYQPGTFMIQHCEPGVDAYSMSISPANSVGYEFVTQ